MGYLWLVIFLTGGCTIVSKDLASGKVKSEFLESSSVEVSSNEIEGHLSREVSDERTEGNTDGLSHETSNLLQP